MILMRALSLWAVLGAGLVVSAAPCWAKTDPILGARLDAATADAVSAELESARQKGLPVDPLVARALEGASRRAPGPRIVAAVRRLAADLERSRDALGAHSLPAELVAGSSALAAGVPPDTLARLRTARAEGSLVVPLVVLTDLVTRRVPAQTASAAVLAALRARVRDEDLMRLRERIDRDIRGGASPGGATIACTRNLIGAFDGPREPASGAAPAPRSRSGP